MVSIRPATVEDAPAITALLLQLGYPETEDTIHRRLAALCGKTDSTVLAAEDGHHRITGCAHVLIDARLAEGRRGEISSIVVDARVRSRGTGARLVQAAAAWLQARNIARLRIRCNARRDQAHRFYETLGFRLTKTQNVFDIPVDALSDRPD